MPSPVSSIPNLGPASELAFRRAGISSAEEIRDLGADEAYRRLLESGSRPHFIGYYVLVMGLQGRPWNDCKGDEKKALRKRFDTLCAGFNRSDAKHSADREQMLSFLGVVDRPQAEPASRRMASRSTDLVPPEGLEPPTL